MVRLLDEEWVLVTNNADDYLDLAARAEVHPGLIFLPLGSAAACADDLARAISHIVDGATHKGETTADAMTNRVVDLRDGEIIDYPWPE